MPDDFGRDHFGDQTDDNVTRIGRTPLTADEKRAKIRAGQTRPQQLASMVIVFLLFTAALGALVRVNIWLWVGR